jgi:ubiquinone/menaquinone biosynthesis C-methylase UbiE
VKCRHCAHELTLPFLDLGSAPPSNAYLTAEGLNAPEVWYPLKVLTCTHCWLVQTEDHAGREALFDDNYAYFSSFSTSWLAHAQAYVHAMVSRFKLDANSRVVEVAANDGYLLQYVQQVGVPCYGIEPTASTAAAAKAKGLAILERFFGVALAQELASQGQQADLMAANNVLAHVPDINDFVGGFAVLLNPQGVATFEFPHLLQMVQHGQFDTAYHEHYSYLSLTAVKRIFVANGLEVFDVQQLPTHGGSLRVFAQRQDLGRRAVETSVDHLLTQEKEAGMLSPDFYGQLGKKSSSIVNSLLLFLISQADQGGSVAAYGGAAKGNTLLNFAGVRPHLLPYVVDANPAKQGKFMPGSRIPIVSEAHLRAHRPSHVLILPWNLKEEVMAQLNYIREWGGKFVTAVPSLEIVG